MSFPALLTRRIGVAPTVDKAPASRDRYGNRERVPGVTVDDVPAGREQVDATEDELNRDQETRTVRYFVALKSTDGTEIALDGRGRIFDVSDVDGTPETFEIVGDPELIRRRGRPHHWEALARRVEG